MAEALDATSLVAIAFKTFADVFISANVMNIQGVAPSPPYAELQNVVLEQAGNAYARKNDAPEMPSPVNSGTKANETADADAMVTARTTASW